MSHVYPPVPSPRGPGAWFSRWRHWLAYPTVFIAGASVVSLTTTTDLDASGSPTPTITVTTTQTPSGVDDSAESKASTEPEAAEATADASTPKTKPSSKPTTKAVAKPKVMAKPTPTQPTVTYRKVSAREWKLIAKSPDAHIGETIVVYGAVTQFDSATGDEGFRANVDGKRHSETYDYDTNTVLTGDSSRLVALVEDDMFSARVTVVGSYSYDTQIGGNTTVPQLHVDGITILD